MDVFILLVDERPEEVTDFKRGLKGATYSFLLQIKSIAMHMRMTRLALHTAILCAETGRDSVVLIDSLTRMSRAFNVETQSYGRTMTGGLGAGALAIPRKIFGAARNVEGGGSLTIIATILVDTGSRMDDIIYQEFKGTGNADIVLSRKCAEQRIWPAINLNASGTRREELLLDDETYQEVTKIRGITFFPGRDHRHVDDVGIFSAAYGIRPIKAIDRANATEEGFAENVQAFSDRATCASA